MKTLCSKSSKGGKIHPSPISGDVDPTAAALRLLPAAILVLTAALCPEDQQVLAYLVTRSLQGAATPTPEPQVARGRRRRAHPPAIGCGCFDCYTSFWSRWDCSPNRELIHVVIDAFEDHLAAAESAPSTPSSSSKRRDKGKRKPPPTPPTPPLWSLMSPESSESQSEKVQEPPSAPASPPPPPSPPPAVPAATTLESSDEEKAPEDSSEVKLEMDAEAVVENADAGEEEEERKRGWADVMGGMLNLRLWGIWSPAVESAT